MTDKVKIVTDSASDIPPSLAEQKSIEIVPLTIRFDEEEYVDRLELTADEFWSKTASASTLPSTAAPSPGAFEAVFRAAADQGHTGVVCINLSSKLSATFQAATTAAAAVKDVIDVRLIDSGTCTVGEATLCLEAADLAAGGASLDEVAQAVEDLRGRIRLFGTLDTLENLKKGGRIGAAGAFFASLLSVKPVITIEDGEVKPSSRQRTRSKALAHLAQMVVDAAPIDHVAVAHSGAPDLDEFLERLSPVVSKDQLLVTEIGPVIGTHGGPRLIAVSYAVK